MIETKGQFVIDFSNATRKSDPENSRRAEEKITKSGSRKSHCHIILECLRLHNGSTSEELAGYLSGVLRHDQIWRRRADLVDNGYIRVDGLKDRFGKWWIL